MSANYSKDPAHVLTCATEPSSDRPQTSFAQSDNDRRQGQVQASGIAGSRRGRARAWSRSMRIGAATLATVEKPRFPLSGFDRKLLERVQTLTPGTAILAAVVMWTGLCPGMEGCRSLRSCPHSSPWASATATSRSSTGRPSAPSPSRANHPQPTTSPARSELATGEDLSNAYLHLVGIGADELPSLDRLRECSLDDARLLLRSTTGDHAQLLKTGRLLSTLQLRLGRDGAIGREAGVVVIEADAMADQHEMVALITVGGSEDHAARLDVDGSAVLRPLGLTFRARRVSTTHAESIRRSLADVDDPACEADNEAPVVPSADTAVSTMRSAAERTEPVAEQLDLDDEPPTERDAPSVVVRVLGVPRIDEAPKLG
ncbi:MAG: hypothetical protein QM733_01185 [Ilumatobacteraceae bacterium]